MTDMVCMEQVDEVDRLMGRNLVRCCIGRGAGGAVARAVNYWPFELIFSWEDKYSNVTTNTFAVSLMSEGHFPRWNSIPFPQASPG